MTTSSQFSWHELHRDGEARVGVMTTPHGDAETPAFMPVGTKATVKGIDCERLRETGASIMLVNTYHLWLRPGSARIAALGGIHQFSGWRGPILSDSGGYQVFSLESLRKIEEQGVHFRSHLDGAKMFLSPERAVGIQEELGVDIAMALDECPKAGLARDDVASSLALTLRWASRCINARSRAETALFGITQGGRFLDLRSESAQALGELPFDGLAIGGLSVGEPKEIMYEVLANHTKELSASKIRYLMGVGTPRDLIEGVRFGVDLFDCVMPTRSGRFGRAFIRGDVPFINLRNATHQQDSMPLDEECRCLACRRYSRAYLHHLFRCDEMLGPQLVSIHNTTHYQDFMQQVRQAVRRQGFSELYSSEVSRWESFDRRP